MKWIVLFVGALGAAGCTTTCESGDLDCVMTTLAVTVDGTAMSLHRIPVDRVLGTAAPQSRSSKGGDTMQMRVIPLSAPNFGNPLQMIEAGVTAQSGTGTGGSAPAPSITNKLSPVSFATEDSEQTVSVEFTDPNGATPAFCWQTCTEDGGWCYPRWVYCSDPLNDVRFQGRAVISFRPQAHFNHPIIPTVPAAITPTDVEPTPVQPSIVHPTPIVGQSAPIMIQWPTPAPDNPVGPDTYSNCMAVPVSCSGVQRCTFQACASVSGATNGCTGGYKASDGKQFPCAGCSNCTSAAMAVLNYCCPPKNGP